MPRRITHAGLGVLLGMALLLVAAARADLTDPTRPALLPPPPSARSIPDAPRLTSVLVSDDLRVAVIDGRRVEVGDRISGTRVIQIELSGVRLRRDDGDVLLTLSGSSFKKPATRDQP